MTCFLSGGRQLKDHRSGRLEGLPEGRDCQVLWRRHPAEDEAVGPAGRGKEEAQG